MIIKKKTIKQHWNLLFQDKILSPKPNKVQAIPNKIVISEDHPTCGKPPPRKPVKKKNSLGNRKTNNLDRLHELDT